MAKNKKNERERQRRFAVSENFDHLRKALHLSESDDKISILQRAVSRISELEMRQKEYESLLTLHNIPFKPLHRSEGEI